ncbi:MAG: hypothetical protein H6895_11960 [Defluviimonas sp.]|uniref:hypothetical protein n=1 Tax=Albidovulum sp. TaxID=1872424 RepID=UPI001D3EB5A7|nr:hypothetical protein [Paracoccaceae bacterium]MCC0064785.1 hypothetical protein [Defluviimonas sp.]
MTALILYVTVLLAPPLLAVAATLRRRRYEIGRGRNGLAPLAGTLFAGATIAYLGYALIGPARSEPWNAPSHLLAAGLSWICFWIWLVFALMRRRGVAQHPA